MTILIPYQETAVLHQARLNRDSAVQVILLHVPLLAETENDLPVKNAMMGIVFLMMAVLTV